MTIQTTFEPLKKPIAFDQFGQIDLRVGQVLEAVKVPKSKKLLKLLVDLGFEKRTIVSGIALSYEPEALVGKKLVIVANLHPQLSWESKARGWSWPPIQILAWSCLKSSISLLAV